MPDVTARLHQDAAQTIRELMAVYRDHEDLISIGAYRRGANRLVDLSIDMQEEINKFLRQRIDEAVSLESAQEALIALHQRAVAKAASAAGDKGQASGAKRQESAGSM